LSDFGTSRACHTLAIVPFFAGDIYGPYLPEGHKNGIGKENVNENGSNELSVPQLLGMSNPTWHYLPDSPAPTLLAPWGVLGEERDLSSGLAVLLEAAAIG